MTGRCSLLFFLAIAIAHYAVPVVAAEAAAPAIESIAPGVWRIHSGTPEAFTPMTQRAAPPALEALAALTQPGDPALTPEDVRIEINPRGAVIKAPMKSNEEIFGLGMSLYAVTSSGKRRTLRVSDRSDALGCSHAPVPFYVSSRGYGLFVDTAREASFYCGDLFPFEVRGEDAPDNGAPATSTEELYRARKPGRRQMIVDVPNCAGVDVYLFAGPSPLDAVRRYNLFCGGGCVPPLWGLGPYYRGHTQQNAEELLHLATSFRNDRIPMTVIGLEPGWHTHAYSCTYDWELKRFPDPAAFIATVRGMGYELNLWEHCFTHPSSPIFEALKPYSGDYLVWQGLVPDFATEGARRVFGDYHEANLITKGVGGFKLDECDDQPLQTEPWSWPHHAMFPSGMDGEQMHALLPGMYMDLLAEKFRANNLRTFGQVRASWGAAAPRPFVLYSDHYDHREYVRALITSGYCGLLWQPELRDCATLGDMYRRLYTTVFSAQTVVNCWYMKNPPWFQFDREKNDRGECMPQYETARDTVRSILELRMKLVPYFYSAFMAYRDEGTPPVRALPLDFPDDEKTYGIEDEYMAGPSLLIAPMFGEETARKVYLPKGGWYDFWTHQRFEGGAEIEVQQPIERIPVFVREGSLLPLAAPLQSIAKDTVFSLEVIAFGAATAPVTLYEDDGITLDFEKGAQSKAVVSWGAGDTGTLERNGAYPAERYAVVSWTRVAE